MDARFYMYHFQAIVNTLTLLISKYSLSSSMGFYAIRVGFHVGRLSTEFYIIMGRRCSHVVKHKPSSNDIMAVC